MPSTSWEMKTTHVHFSYRQSRGLWEGFAHDYSHQPRLLVLATPPPSTQALHVQHLRKVNHGEPWGWPWGQARSGLRHCHPQALGGTQDWAPTTRRETETVSCMAKKKEGSRFSLLACMLSLFGVSNSPVPAHHCFLSSGIFLLLFSR